jgi:hypothetical protein
VFWGLILERMGDKEEYSSTRQFRACKKRRKCGEMLVIIGVGIETVVALGFAGKDVWDRMQLANEIAKNNPMGQPISDISADVMFFLNSSNLENNMQSGPPLALPGYLFFNIVETNTSKNFNPFEALLSDGLRRRNEDLQVWRSATFLQVEMHFHLASFLAGASRQNPNEPVTVSDIFNGVDSLEIFIPQIKNTAEVMRGHVDLLINGGITKAFEIFPQINATNKAFYNCLQIIATNTPANK